MSEKSFVSGGSGAKKIGMLLRSTYIHHARHELTRAPSLGKEIRAKGQALAYYPLRQTVMDFTVSVERGYLHAVLQQHPVSRLRASLDEFRSIGSLPLPEGNQAQPIRISHNLRRAKTCTWPGSSTMIKSAKQTPFLTYVDSMECQVIDGKLHVSSEEYEKHGISRHFPRLNG